MNSSAVAMGIWDAFTDIVEAVTPWSVVEAEAPAEDTQVRDFPTKAFFVIGSVIDQLRWGLIEGAYNGLRIRLVKY